jgi:hypothetical protein
VGIDRCSILITSWNRTNYSYYTYYLYLLVERYSCLL